MIPATSHLNAANSHVAVSDTSTYAGKPGSEGNNYEHLTVSLEHRSTERTDVSLRSEIQIS